MSNEPDVPPPPRPRRTPFVVDETPERLELCLQVPAWDRVFTGCFTLFWLTAWTVGCVFLLVEVVRNPKVLTLLFAVPFWIAWIAVFHFVVGTIFGRERVVLDGEGLAWSKRRRAPARDRFVPLAELVRFQQFEANKKSDSGSTVGVEAVTLGRPLRFGATLDGRERAWLLDELNRRLATSADASGAGWSELVDAERLVFRARLKSRSDDASRAFTAADAPHEPPSDSRWRAVQDFDGFSVAARARLNPSLLGGAVLIAGFWNGIVSVFVYILIFGDKNGVPQGPAWWFLCLFLIPFEAIGAFLFVMLLGVLFEPAHVRRYFFGNHGLTASSTWFGLGRRRTIEVAGLDRLEVVLVAAKPPGCGNIAAAEAYEFPDETPTYSLVLVDAENREAATVDRLAFGEACWLAGLVLQWRGDWFR